MTKTKRSVTRPPAAGTPFGVYRPAFVPQTDVPHVVVLADGPERDGVDEWAEAAIGVGEGVLVGAGDATQELVVSRRCSRVSLHLTHHRRAPPDR